MTTPINPGDAWTLSASEGLGTGVGAIPTGVEVAVDDVLPPFSAGVAQVNETVVCCIYNFTDFVQDSTGALVEGPNSRRLAFSESDFRSLFVPVGGA